MAAFEGLERDPAELRIREAAGRGTLSHALLFTGSGDRVGLARYAAAAMECTADRGQPCGACPACRKVGQDIHPDVITVRDPDHKNIAVREIDEAQNPVDHRIADRNQRILTTHGNASQ